MVSTSGPAVIAGPPQQRPDFRALPRRRRRRVALLAVGVAVLGLLAVTSTFVLRGNSMPKLETFAIPTSYHVTYAITTPKSGESPNSETTEQLWVRRPFDSVDVTLDGPPPGNTAYLTIVNRLGAQVLKSENGRSIQLRVPAAAAPQDVRGDLLVPAGLRAGLLKREGTAVVAGRQCQVFRSANSLRAGPLQPLTSSTTYTDTCLDTQGLVLLERSVNHGRVMSERRAVLVAVGPAAVTSAPFELQGTPQPSESGGGAFTALTLGSRPPGGSWALLHPPAGFQHVGRYAVIPPQPQAAATPGLGTAPQPGLISEMDDVFVRGTDVIVVQQGATLNGAEFKPPPNALPVAAGALGNGQLQIGGAMVTISAEPYGGRRFVRVSTTLPAEQALSIARSLASQPGGTLTRLHGKADS